MTDMEKVIKALEHCKDNQLVIDCNKCDYGGETGMFCIRMIDDVITLLKENKPMQPKNIWHTIDHTSNGDCPKCGGEVNQFDNSMCCGRCGQSLDWRNLQFVRGG